MSILNENYSEIRRQIHYADSHFIQCRTREDFYNCFATYEMLCKLYEWQTGEDLFDLSGSLKLMGKVVTDSFEEETVDKFYDDFYRNRTLAFKLFEKPFLEGKIVYTDFLRYDGNHLKSIPYKELSSDVEGMQIISAFLDSKFPSMMGIFDELVASGRIFKTSGDMIQSRAYIFYNPLENIGDLFFRKPFTTISDLSDFIHEFGHVVDFNNLNSKQPQLCAPTVRNLAYDSEVMSCYYQFQFLEYLIRNHIYKEDALKVLDDTIAILLYELENGFLLGLAERDEYKGLITGSIAKRSYIAGLLDRGIEVPSDLILNEFDGVISILDASKYSYGVSLGCAIADDSIYNSFIANQGINILEMLDKTGITSDKVAKEFTKKIEILYQGCKFFL